MRFLYTVFGAFLFFALPAHAQPEQSAAAATAKQDAAFFAGGVVVNTTTTNDQQNPSLGMASDGSYVVVWASLAEDGSGYGVYGQRYNSDGTANGSAFAVNTTTSGNQQRPAIAMLPDGQFAVAWMDDSTGLWRVMLQRYAANGTAAGVETALASSADYFKFPALTTTGSGIYAAAWQRIAADGSTFSVEVARISASDGSSVGTHTPATGATWLGDPAIAGATADDRFVVAWQGKDGDGSDGVFAHRYDTNGDATGSAFPVPNSTAGSQTEPGVAMDGTTGQFAITWTDGTSLAAADAYARRYDTDGSALANAFVANTTTASAQRRPRPVMAAASGNQGGRLTVAWDSFDQDGDFAGVYYQVYDNVGQPFGFETQASSITDGFQQHVALAQPSADLNLGLVWQGGQRHETIGNDGFDVFAYQPVPDPTVYVSGTAGTGNDTGWRMLASPCATRTRSNLSYSASITGNDEVRLFDESAGMDDARWLEVTSGTTLPQGQGFIAFLFDDAGLTVEPGFGIGFTGCAESTADFDRTGLDVNEQFYLAGNPYYTTFDLSDGLDLPAAGHQATVQVWDPTADGGTGSYQLIVRGDAEDLIAMGQGFFVERTTLGEGATTLPFKAAGRTTGGDFVGKGEGTNTWARLEIGLHGTSIDSVQVRDEAATLLFLPEGTTGWDAYEATKYTPLTPIYATAAFLGSRGDSTVARALASYPGALNAPLDIPVQIDGRGFTGPLTLSWLGLDQLPEDWTLSLEDQVLGTSVDLRQETDYTFDFTAPAGKGPSGAALAGHPVAMAVQATDSRFMLQIRPGINTAIDGETPHTFALEAAYPNPFNPTTTIRYALAERSDVRLVVYDALGRQVQVLRDGVQPAGRYTATFDAANLSSGVYIYRLETPAFQATRTVLLLK